MTRRPSTSSSGRGEAASSHHAPWELVPYPEPADDVLRAIVDKHDLEPRPVRPMAATGVINSVYRLGDDLVLRIPKDVAEGISNTLTESVVVPVVHAAGVRTPALVVFDGDCDVIDVPYTIYDWVQGASLDADEPPSSVAAVYRGLGADLARLHDRVATCDDPAGRLATPRRRDLGPILRDLQEARLIGAETARWLERVFDRLRPAVERATGLRRLVHDDTQPPNVMARGGRYAALIDWGDSGWGDPAFDLRHMPLRAVPHVLEGYRSIGAMDQDDDVEARVLWDHLSWALLRLLEAPGTQPSDWAAPQSARLLEVLAFAVSTPGRRWYSDHLDGVL